MLALAAVGCAHQEPPARRDIPFGAFLGSGESGVQAYPGFQAWLGDRWRATVGHTYLSGATWSDIDDPTEFVAPWARWVTADPARMLVVNVPILVPNEPALPDADVAELLAQGARGDFDQHFRSLARRLLSLGVAGAVLVPGWEMNGTSYTGRCAPAPEAWKAYWRRIVAAMRSVPGSRFRFDFTPSRGADKIAWQRCYPGDDVVDIIGIDSYDQPPGTRFADFRDQPQGLAEQAAFASVHGKQVSFAEWGLRKNGDEPAYVTSMLEWMGRLPTAYQTITDYCPSGIWRCQANPRSSAAYRVFFNQPDR
jgi:hypothetical protein